MNLFNVSNFPECEVKDKIILKLLQELNDSRPAPGSGYKLAFDLDSMSPIYTKQQFVNFKQIQGE